MTTGREVAIRENELPMLSPAEIVGNATVQAKLLMDIVEQTKCYQQIRDKKYLQVEAWETIGAFNRTHAETDYIEPILQEGNTIGYRAKVQLWKDGIVIGGAVMPCYFTENACKGKEGDAKHKASMSAAQTFATSKAYRMNYSYVAILAGYAATPAEEMTGEDSTTPDHTKHHWCDLHDCVFFKKGKMQNYAHPIVDEQGNKTGEWCNEPEPDKRGLYEKEGRDATKEATDKVFKTKKTEPEKEQEQGVTPTVSTTAGVGEPESIIDLEWLKESLNSLQWTDCVGWLNRTYGTSGKRVSEIVKELTAEQASEFTAEVQSRLEML